jgi:transcriptional repressor NrdR
MRCPFCGAEHSQVKDSRSTDDGGAIRRRRSWPNCAARFTTFERVQLRELTVIKKNGQREPFGRDKLARSIYTALRKRPHETDRVERIINSIVRQLESSGETEIPSDMIGELVMEARWPRSTRSPISASPRSTEISEKPRIWENSLARSRRMAIDAPRRWSWGFRE